MVSIFSREITITDENAWDLWLKGKITNQQITAYLFAKGIAKITRNWGSQVLHIKTFNKNNLRPPKKLDSVDIDGRDEDNIIRFDLLIPELEKVGIKVWIEEGLKDAPTWRNKMLGKNKSNYHS